MEEILKADIFFFVATVAMVVITILVCIFLYHLIKTVKLVKQMIKRLEEGSEAVVKDLSRVRAKFFSGSLIGLVASLFGALTTGLGKFRYESAAKAVDDEDVSGKK